MKRIAIEKIVTDVYFTGVKLPNGRGGISCIPTTGLHCPCCSILTMGQKRGASKGAVVYDILASPPVSSLITTAEIVVMNTPASACARSVFQKNPLEASRQT